MAISYPLAFPAQLRRSVHVTWTPKANVGLNVTEFTGAQQVTLANGEWWEVDIELTQMNRADSDIFEAFLVSLRGEYGTFLYGDHVRRTTRGTASGAWAVGAGALAGARTLPIQGGSGLFAIGDRIQVGTQLLRVLQVNSGSLDVFPLLRANVAQGTAIVFTDAKGVFRLKSGPSFDHGLSRAFGPYMISATEAFSQ